MLKKTSTFQTENECNIYTKFHLGAIFSLIDSYNRFVPEVYEFYNGNAEPDLTEASCESLDIITAPKPPEQEDDEISVSRRERLRST